MNTFFTKKYNTFYLKTFLFFAYLVAIPVGAVESPQDAKGVLDLFRNMLTKSILPFLISLGLVLFLIGVVRFVGAGDNEEKRQAGRNVMIYGIIVLFVMISIWGLVGLLTQSFTGNSPILPNTLPELR